MSRFDVIVPSYNYGRFLREAVESVLTQPVDVRVLVIDDASTDDTSEVAHALSAEDRRVEFRSHTVNRGNIATYNEGLEWTSSDYTLLLSADDLLTPGALARAQRVLDTHPEVGFVYGRALRFQDGGTRPHPRNLDQLPWQVITGGEYLERVCREGEHSIHSPEIVVRTSLQRQLGGYLPALRYSGDLELWMRFAIHASVAILDADQAYYRIHSKNMSHDWLAVMDTQAFTQELAGYQQRKAAFDALFEGHGPLIPDGKRLHGMANESLAWNAFWSAHRAFEAGDGVRCQQLLDFASALFPDLAQTRAWARLSWKRRLGRKVWARVSHAVDRLRGRPGRNGFCLSSSR